MVVNWVQLDNGDEVRKLLDELYSLYKKVEIIGITEGPTNFNVFYMLGKEGVRE